MTFTVDGRASDAVGVVAVRVRDSRRGRTSPVAGEAFRGCFWRLTNTLRAADAGAAVLCACWVTGAAIAARSCPVCAAVSAAADCLDGAAGTTTSLAAAGAAGGTVSVPTFSTTGGRETEAGVLGARAGRCGVDGRVAKGVLLFAIAATGAGTASRDSTVNVPA
ncbi:MAG: hypothetical protein A3K18_31420 [Lentisphaerae bacterium RIFOXYA12_64_32]|nr:MAG: hypothetical protein A3K18_31420 [Lentisphaerae bacterium RIFOXYA12_64_32]